MPRPRKDDFFGTIRTQAERALAIISAEIARRESELKHLMEQARGWKSALGAGNAASARRRVPTARLRVSRAAGSRSAKRVDWDEVLASVPKRFGVKDVLKHPGARAKGKAQIYPAFTRWEAAKKIRRVSQGQYERVSGGGSQTRPKAKARAASTTRKARRRPKRLARARGVKRGGGKA